MRDGSDRRPLTVLAFDFGLKRIGIAVGDTVTGTAAPRPAVGGGPDWAAIEREIRAQQPGLLVVGAPFNADGTPGTMLSAAQAFARELERRFAIPVREVDERCSSIEAGAALARMRRAERHRRRRVRKEDIDSAAAADLSGSCERVRSWIIHGHERSRTIAGGRIARHLLTLESLPKALIENLLERAQGFVQAGGERSRVSAALEGRHGCEPLHRAFDAHSGFVRAGGQAARRRSGESRGAALLARQGREHARYRIHARGAATSTCW